MTTPSNLILPSSSVLPMARPAAISWALAISSWLRPRSRRSMLYYVVEFVVSSGLVLLCVYLGWNSAYVDPFPPPSPPPPSWPPLNPTAVARALG